MTVDQTEVKASNTLRVLLQTLICSHMQNALYPCRHVLCTHKFANRHTRTIQSIHQMAIKDRHTILYNAHQPWQLLPFTHQQSHTPPPLGSLQTVMMACVWEVNGCLLPTTFTLDYSSPLLSGLRGTSPGHHSPSCHHSHKYALFIRNVNEV